MDEQRYPAGRLVTALGCDRQVRILVASFDGPARELCDRHRLDPGASRIAGAGLVAAGLLGSQLKGPEQLAVNIYGERPSFKLHVDLRGQGAVRGSMEPAALTPAGDDGATADPHDARFDGLMAVLKFLGNEELYRGVAEVHDQDVRGALQGFFDRSLQVDARVRIRVAHDDEGRLRVASGMLVERLPDVDGEAFAELLAAGLEGDPAEALTAFAFGQFAGAPVEVLDTREVVFRCECSRERVEGMLRALGPDDLTAMIREDDGAEVTCHFCNEVYRLDAGALRALRDERTGAAAGQAAEPPPTPPDRRR